MKLLSYYVFKKKTLCSIRDFQKDLNVHQHFPKNFYCHCRNPPLYYGEYKCDYINIFLFLFSDLIYIGKTTKNQKT